MCFVYHSLTSAEPATRHHNTSILLYKRQSLIKRKLKLTLEADEPEDPSPKAQERKQYEWTDFVKNNKIETALDTSKHSCNN